MTWNIEGKAVLVTGGTSGPRWMGLAMTILKPLLASPDRGAATSVHLATAPHAALEGGLYWSSSKPKEPSKAALDGGSARRLWETSSELVGLG